MTSGRSEQAGLRVEFWADGQGGAEVQVTDDAGVILGRQRAPADWLQHLAATRRPAVWALNLYRPADRAQEIHIRE